eukprot:m.451219 g.451219  ORF g.451219 m.451219 type:complete len:601 (+) comp20323_c0_seq13:1859-3661(+)
MNLAHPLRGRSDGGWVEVKVVDGRRGERLGVCLGIVSLGVGVCLGVGDLVVCVRLGVGEHIVGVLLGLDNLVVGVVIGLSNLYVRVPFELGLGIGNLAIGVVFGFLDFGVGVAVDLGLGRGNFTIGVGFSIRQPVVAVALGLDQQSVGVPLGIALTLVRVLLCRSGCLANFSVNVISESGVQRRVGVGKLILQRRLQIVQVLLVNAVGHRKNDAVEAFMQVDQRARDHVHFVIEQRVIQVPGHQLERGVFRVQLDVKACEEGAVVTKGLVLVFAAAAVVPEVRCRAIMAVGTKRARCPSGTRVKVVTGLCGRGVRAVFLTCHNDAVGQCGWHVVAGETVVRHDGARRHRHVGVRTFRVADDVGTRGHAHDTCALAVGLGKRAVDQAIRLDDRVAGADPVTSVAVVHERRLHGHGFVVGEPGHGPRQHRSVGHVARRNVLGRRRCRGGGRRRRLGRGHVLSGGVADDNHAFHGGRVVDAVVVDGPRPPKRDVLAVRACALYDAVRVVGDDVAAAVQVALRAELERVDAKRSVDNHRVRLVDGKVELWVGDTIDHPRGSRANVNRNHVVAVPGTKPDQHQKHSREHHRSVWTHDGSSCTVVR